jgi:hypothetical protein
MEMSNIESYYNLKEKNVATLVDINDNVEIQFKRFNSDTGEEMTNALSHVPVTLDDLNNMKTDYQSKIDLIDDFITEINNL